MLFVIGGSLGAKNINQGILKNLEKITIENNIKLFWGTGKENYDEINGRIRKFILVITLILLNGSEQEKRMEIAK